MPTKRLVSKRARRSPPPPVAEPKFSNEAHKTRYTLLSREPFGTIRRIEWEALRILGLQNTVREYISPGGWDKVFEIEEPTFRELTLEVLSTTEITIIALSLIKQVQYLLGHSARNTGFLKTSWV